MPGSVLQRAYFERPTLEVARDLLGTYLVRHGEDGTSRAGRIVEVEAYIGGEDLACHASRGRTKRTEVMFGPAGIAYVYLIYGMYHCLNVVTEQEEFPAAVLIRAVEIDGMLIGGPGKLCRDLAIDRTHNYHDLTSGRLLWIEDRGERPTASMIRTGPRVGVDYAGRWARKPWRFLLGPPPGAGATRKPLRGRPASGQGRRSRQ